MSRIVNGKGAEWAFVIFYKVETEIIFTLRGSMVTKVGLTQLL